MTTLDPSQLRDIKTFADVIEFLRDELDWPIGADDFEDVTFDYTPEELGHPRRTGPHLASLRQLRPLGPHQPWGIFFVKFDGPRLPLTALRRLLDKLVTKKRASRLRDATHLEARRPPLHHHDQHRRHGRAALRRVLRAARRGPPRSDRSRGVQDSHPRNTSSASPPSCSRTSPGRTTPPPSTTGEPSGAPRSSSATARSVATTAKLVGRMAATARKDACDDIRAVSIGRFGSGDPDMRQQRGTGGSRGPARKSWHACRRRQVALRWMDRSARWTARPPPAHCRAEAWQENPALGDLFPWQQPVHVEPDMTHCPIKGFLDKRWRHFVAISDLMARAVAYVRGPAHTADLIGSVASP